MSDERYWLELDLQRAREYSTQAERETELKLVQGEHSGVEEYDRPCWNCDGTLQYRPTIGALQCPDCRALAHTNGTPIGQNQTGHWNE
jgi:hypothetical protein